jgi:hypothetical protein
MGAALARHAMWESAFKGASVIFVLGLVLALRPMYICESGSYLEHEHEQCDPPGHLARVAGHKGGTSSRGSLSLIFVCTLQANGREVCRQPAKVTANSTITSVSVITPVALIMELSVSLLVCLFSWRYSTLWLYFPQPGSGL